MYNLLIINVLRISNIIVRVLKNANNVIAKKE
jgi:hypothetical protein